jgi:hypothetical protein
MNRTPFAFAFVLGLACSGATSGETNDSTDTDGFAVCGNGVVDGTEACDGEDLGEQTCADRPGFVGGTLSCLADCQFDTTMCEADAAGAVVRINEVTSSEITDGDYAGAGDAIELFNAGAQAADLSGFQLSDEADFPAEKSYTFPDGTMLAAGEFLVLVKLDDTTMMGDYPFGISSTDPETLRLGDATGAVVDTAEFVGADAAISWCRVPDGDGEWQTCARTFGASNEPGAADETTAADPVCGDGMIEGDEACDGEDLGGLDCTDASANFTGGTLACADDCTLDVTGCDVSTRGPLVVLNELRSSDTDDIEIHNAGEADADLSGWILTDDLAAPDDPYDAAADLEAFVFADGTTLAAGAFLVVPGGEAAGEHLFGLSGDGDAVSLLDADLVVVDFVAYGLDEAATSYCRMPDGPEGAWQADCMPSFGDSNGG